MDAGPLLNLVDEWHPRLLSLSDAEAAIVVGSKWNRKEILGHLLDSAVNNQQRFIRLQTGDLVGFPGYDQEQWVAAGGYRQGDWQSLVQRWCLLNRQLAVVIAQIPLDAEGHIWQDQGVDLAFLVQDYTRHTWHHLQKLKLTKPMDYWAIGVQYLRLAELACSELCKEGNLNIVTCDEPITWEYYDKRTEWSDHSVGIPIIFNFYHGIEIILKSFIRLHDQNPKNHSISNLLNKFEDVYSRNDVSDIIHKYMDELHPESPLSVFFRENNLSVDDWYLAFKYPESKNGINYKHTCLKFGGDNTIPFWKDLGNSALNLRKAALKLADTETN